MLVVRDPIRTKSDLLPVEAVDHADCGLRSADLAGGIRRVRGVKKLGVDWAIGRPPKQGELAELTFHHLHQREGHWAIVDLSGKAGHVRTVPVPDWVYGLVDDWTKAAGIRSGRLFRRVRSEARVLEQGSVVQVTAFSGVQK